MRRSVLALTLAAAAVWAAAEPNEARLRKAIVETALTFRGVPYVYGAESPNAFDCSGFVRYVYGKATGLVIPRTSKAMFAAGTPVKPAQAQPGDVLVFDTVGGAPSHVALVLDGKSMIHAASAGPVTGVIVSPLTDRYFAPRVIGAREFLERATAVPMPAPEPAAAPAPAKPAQSPAPAPAKPAAVPAPAPAPAPAQTQPAKPAPAPAAPAARPAAVADEPVVSSVGFSITNQASIFTDKIPAATGTALQFAVTNDTGADGVFEILFYKMDMDPSKNQTLRKDRVRIGAGKMVEVAPFTFTESGQYKLILKTHDNIKRVERIWRVVDVK